MLSDLHLLSPGGSIKSFATASMPRTRFVSLIICLPGTFLSAKPRVSTTSHTTTFDWMAGKKTSSKSKAVSCVQWAAFVNCCKADIRSIESGHLMILTYALVVKEQVGNPLSSDDSLLDASLNSLFDSVAEILEQPGFMKKRGILAFYCQHNYSHANPTVCPCESTLPTPFHLLV